MASSNIKTRFSVPFSSGDILNPDNMALSDKCTIETPCSQCVSEGLALPDGTLPTKTAVN